MRRAAWLPAASALAALLALVAMLKLPGRTSTHSWLNEEDAVRAPVATGFHLDSLQWDVASMKRDARLEPLRAFMKNACPGRLGLDAARCISDALAEAFPNAPPPREFLDATYDPVSDFQSHLAGVPGHCTTRSGLTAAILLASGHSARQVQIVGDRAHNVLEVYVGGEGWRIFDPTFGVGYAAEAAPTRLLSVVEAVHADRLIPVRLGRAASDLSDAPSLVEEALYPDPWLYTRSGSRVARWPYRGHFAHVGRVSIEHGLGQRLARIGFVLSSLSAVATGIRYLRLRARRRRVGVSVAAPTARPAAASLPSA